jgi:hypothetical protein
MRKSFTVFILIVTSVLITTLMSSCFLFKQRGKTQFRQAPPPKTTTTAYDRKAVKTKTKGRNYKNQYRSDWRGHRGGRDPYNARGGRYKYN